MALERGRTAGAAARWGRPRGRATAGRTTAAAAATTCRPANSLLAASIPTSLPLSPSVFRSSLAPDGSFVGAASTSSTSPPPFPSSSPFALPLWSRHRRSSPLACADLVDRGDFNGARRDGTLCSPPPTSSSGVTSTGTREAMAMPDRGMLLCTSDRARARRTVLPRRPGCSSPATPW